MVATTKLTDPSGTFMRTMMSLYFTNKVDTYVAGDDEAETLPPMEALVLGMMCLNKTYNSRAFSNRLFSYRTFDSRECDVFSDAGILRLMERGYLKPASKKAEQALNQRNDRVWGLGDVPFVITAKGAKRIGHLVANLTGENVKEVVTRLQAESKEKAKAWSTD
jgi:hypothetical protein